MTKVFINNVGEFHVPNERLSDLLNYLEQISAIKGSSPETYVQEVIKKNFNGRELIRD